MKRLYFLGLLFIFSLFISAFAANKVELTPDPTNKTVELQTFAVTKPVNVELKLSYTHRKIQSFIFRNQSTQTLKVSMFETAYELKPEAELSIQVPNVKHIVAEISIYNPEIINTAKTITPANVYLFRRQSDGIFVLYSTY